MKGQQLRQHQRNLLWSKQICHVGHTDLITMPFTSMGPPKEKTTWLNGWVSRWLWV